MRLARSLRDEMKRSVDDTQSDVTLGGLGTGPLVPHTRLEPKLLTILRRGYTRKQFARDVVAGLIVGIVALPLAIAFAIASGVKPEQGIYTAILAGFVAAALGGSRAQVSGPTGAFIVIIYGIVQQYGYDGLAVATKVRAGHFPPVSSRRTRVLGRLRSSSLAHERRRLRRQLVLR